MVTDGSRGFGRDDPRPLPVADEPLEVRRYLSALRRDWRLIAFIVLIATALSFVISLTAEDRYRARARIVFEQDENLFQRQDVESIKRELATMQTLVETPEVLRQAAQRFPDETESDLDKKVSSTVDANANIISVVATDENAQRAAALANAVSSIFITKRRDVERARLQRERAALVAELDRLRDASGTRIQIQALRARLSDLSLLIAGAGSKLQIAEAASPPTSPYAPQPFRTALFAFFASMVVAAIVVLGRDQLKPRISGVRELARLLDVPILARVPWIRVPRIVSTLEDDAYQTLQAQVRFRQEEASPTVLLVTSAVQGEGKTRVTAGLGLALAQTGVPTLLVSADLRSPALHEFFNITSETGLAELLSGERDLQGMSETFTALLQRSTAPYSRLHVFASPTRRTDAASLLSSEALDTFFEEVTQLPYEYVLVDAPPLLGTADSRLLARCVDQILLVSRLDRLNPENVLDMREVLDTLETEVLGLVVVGGERKQPRYAVDNVPAVTERL